MDGDQAEVERLVHNARAGLLAIGESADARDPVFALGMMAMALKAERDKLKAQCDAWMELYKALTDACKQPTKDATP